MTMNKVWNKFFYVSFYTISEWRNSTSKNLIYRLICSCLFTRNPIFRQLFFSSLAHFFGGFLFGFFLYLFNSGKIDAITDNKFDAAFGGARRDEDKARAKERILSFRDSFGQWDPKAQRPELWNLYQGRVNSGEHLRAFPLSDWTELDIWQYIEREEMKLPTIYFAHEREVIFRDGMWLAVGRFVEPKPSETIESKIVRFRTVGDANCTGAVLSKAATLADIVAEVSVANVSERGATRADDKFSETAMEDRKREGYF